MCRIRFWDTTKLFLQGHNLNPRQYSCMPRECDRRHCRNVR
jgi:hypothetical protein